MSDTNTADTGTTGEATNPTNTATPQDNGATVPPGAEGQGGGEAAGAPQGDGEGGGNANPKPDDQQGAPEQYQAFNMPEGFTLEGERLNTAAAFFKTNGWTQEQAQQAVDLYSQMAGQDAAAIKQALDDQRTTQIAQWGEQLKQQLGDKYDQTVGDARTAVQAVNNPELVKAFDEQGWGNHPELVNAFAFFGRFLRDSPMDGLGGGTSTGAVSDGDRMYQYADKPTPRT